jgi:hypothetical protein
VKFAEEAVWRTSAAMEKVGDDRLEELEKMLSAGTAGEVDPELAALGPLGDEAAAELIEKARPEYEQGKAIVRLRKELHEHIDQAQRVIRDAFGSIRDLSGWGDVEYEGGHRDTEDCLNEALRQLRLAQAVKPSDKDGELKP